jgi:hypothetical protein
VGRVLHWESAGRALRWESAGQAPHWESVDRALRWESVDRALRWESAGQAPHWESVDRALRWESAGQAPHWESVDRVLRWESAGQAPHWESVDRVLRWESAGQAPHWGLVDRALTWELAAAGRARVSGLADRANLHAWNRRQRQRSRECSGSERTKATQSAAAASLRADNRWAKACALSFVALRATVSGRTRISIPRSLSILHISLKAPEMRDLPPAAMG